MQKNNKKTQMFTDAVRLTQDEDGVPNTDGRVGGNVRRGAVENLILCPPPRRLRVPDSQFVAKQHFLAASRAPLRRERRDRWRLLLTWLKLKMLLQDYCSRATAARSVGVVVHRLDKSPALSFDFIFLTFCRQKR